MDNKVLKIGTRESELAVWQANRVKDLLAEHGYQSELVYIKSEGDLDLQTPLYELGIQGIFTRSLDIALLNKRIDLAVHSMKDVPTQLPKGIAQCAVLKRASFKDLLVYNGDVSELEKSIAFLDGQWSKVDSQSPSSGQGSVFTVATSSIRRKAQWLNRYPNHSIQNLRGNVN
ncbi:MAG: hydroxymethylbilane synthase, partial [Segetibacter sp.]